jgi:predicted  nucleic acid-binding Zn-ribbon protein
MMHQALEFTMSDLESEIRDLRERTKHNRHEFLKADTQTCFIAVERAHLELSLGNTHEAQKELELANRGVQVIQRFLSEAPGQMPEIEAKLADLKESLESLRLEIDSFPR